MVGNANALAPLAQHTGVCVEKSSTGTANYLFLPTRAREETRNVTVTILVTVPGLLLGQ